MRHLTGRVRALLSTSRQVLGAMKRRLLQPGPRAIQVLPLEPECVSVLVVAPHPDDEVIGCGGAILRHVAAGGRVACVVLNRGELSRGAPALSPEERARAREAESRASAAALGIEEIVFLPGRNFTRAGEAERTQLAEVLARRKPAVVYLPHYLENHPDHYEANRALAAAWNPARGTAVIRAYEVWTPLLTANRTVDITGQLDRKLEALACHKVALEAVDYLHSSRGLAAYRSIHAQAGKGYAEAFFEEDAATYLESIPV